jgi:hypothetical protein
MAKARIVTSEGAEVNIDGTPSEIAAVLKELKITARATDAAPRAPTKSLKPRSGRTTLPGLFEELIASKFFTKPKGIGDVRTQLADLGHVYPTTSLSGPLQGYVRKRKLRRFKKDGKYVYAQ